MKRLIPAALALFCVYTGVGPLFISRMHTGCLVLMLLGVLLLVAAIWPGGCFHVLCVLWHAVWGKILYAVVAALCVLFVVISSMMVTAACRRPVDQDGAVTVIVLGAGLRGENPSRMLRNRLEVAYTYLESHPQAVCIVSGGQNPDEVLSEATVMQRYLLKKGLAADRIFTEDRSTSTYENIRFSKQVIVEQKLPEAVAIVTQEFHQYRGQAFARKAGFTAVSGLTVHTEFMLLPGYWIRDVAGVCHMLLFGT